MKTNINRLLKYQSLALVTGLAVFAALWATPEAAHGQVVGGDLFATVNLGGSFNNGASTLYQYTPEYVPPGGTPSIFASALDTPRGVAIDKRQPADGGGNLYVATNYNLDASVDPPPDLPRIQGTILKISPDGLMSTFATGFPVSFLQGLATDSTGNVFVTAQDDGFTNAASAIYKITPDGILSLDPPFASLDFTGWGLACDSAGYVYVATSDGTNGMILRFAPDGTPDSSPFVGPANFPSTGPGPIGLAFDGGQPAILFVSTVSSIDNSGDIRKFDSNGTEITPPFATGLTKGPRGLAFDGAGNLFVAEIGNPGTSITGDILEFTPGGTQTVFASQNFGTRGNRGPEWLAFTTGAVIPPTTAVTLTLPDATEPLTATVTLIDQNSVPPPPSNFVKLSGRQVTDGVTTINSPTITSNTAAFTQADVGLPVSGAGLPPNGTIASVQSGTQATLNANCTVTATGVTILVGSNLAFDISTTATPTPPIIIAFTVSPLLDLLNLKALHYECDTQDPPVCQWQDRTIYRGDPNYPSSPAPYTIYGSVSSLSPFLVAKFEFGAQIQQPINADGTSVFSVRRGVVPVKFTLTDNGSSTCTLPAATIAVTRTAGGTIGAIDESVYGGSADTGSNFRIASCQYTYNLSASALGVGTYRVDIKINGTVVGSGIFGLK